MTPAVDATTIGVIAAPIGTTVVAFFGYLATRTSSGKAAGERAIHSLEAVQEQLDEQRARTDIAMQVIYDQRAEIRALGGIPRRLPPELQTRRVKSGEDDCSPPTGKKKGDKHRDHAGPSATPIAEWVRAHRPRDGTDDDQEPEDADPDGNE